MEQTFSEYFLKQISETACDGCGRAWFGKFTEPKRNYCNQCNLPKPEDFIIHEGESKEE